MHSTTSEKAAPAGQREHGSEQEHDPENPQTPYHIDKWAATAATSDSKSLPGPSELDRLPGTCPSHVWHEYISPTTGRLYSGTLRGISIMRELVTRALRGDKTQTRRVLTVPWHRGKRALPWSPTYDDLDGELFVMDENGDYVPALGHIRCPYGKPGDLLYVRESWRTKRRHDNLSPSDLVAWGVYRAECGLGVPLEFSDGTREEWSSDYPDDLDAPGRKRAAMHMPRAFSRLTLGVVDVWDALNGAKPGCAVADNPWVWAVTFELVEVQS